MHACVFIKLWQWFSDIENLWLLHDEEVPIKETEKKNYIPFGLLKDFIVLIPIAAKRLTEFIYIEQIYTATHSKFNK